MKTNAYFEAMMQTVRDWRAARDERSARKQTIIDTYGWESKELEAWYKEDSAAKYPFTGGEGKALQAWRITADREEDELEMDDFLWESETHDFIETLRKAGIESFVYTNRSTAVMENLHAFAAEGCEMTGLCTIAYKADRFGGEQTIEAKGIRFTVK
nr:MAG TPA: hypothetical protein [Caudoviricetes sp.]